MKNCTDDDTTPKCANCKKKDVRRTTYLPFDLRAKGLDGPESVKFSTYCDLCEELHKIAINESTKQEEIEQRFKAISKSGEIPWFGTHDMKRINQDTVIAFGEAAFTGNKRKKNGMQLKETGVYCYGGTGKCKSRAASRLSEAVIALGHTFLWVGYADALRGHVDALKAEGAMRNGYMNALAKPTVLLIDDFGKGNLTPTGLEFLFSLINSRYEKMGSMLCPLWITAQDTPEVVLRENAPHGSDNFITPLVRRLKEMTTEVKV